VRSLAGALAVLAVLPAAARADTFTATAASPRDPALDANADLQQLSASFDTAGSFALDVAVYGVVPTDVTGIVYAAGCGVSIASVTTDPPPGGQSATVNRAGATPHAPQSLSLTITNGHLVARIADGDLAGVQPGCVTVTTARDALSSIPFTGPPLPMPSPTPTPTPTPPAVAPSPLTIAFANPGARLTASRRGVVAIRLAPFAAAVRGSVRVRAGTRTLGSSAYRAAAGRPITVHVRLSASARRRLAYHHALAVTLVATAHAGATHVSATSTTTVRRR
jgi:hypothetical protein